ncbi:hypothetical protein DMENIID0001_164490 [Sergentomyia squamirostris]
MSVPKNANLPKRVARKDVFAGTVTSEIHTDAVSIFHIVQNLIVHVLRNGETAIQLRIVIRSVEVSKNNVMENLNVQDASVVRDTIVTHSLITVSLPMSVHPQNLSVQLAKNIVCVVIRVMNSVSCMVEHRIEGSVNQYVPQTKNTKLVESRVTNIARQKILVKTKNANLDVSVFLVINE